MKNFVLALITLLFFSTCSQHQPQIKSGEGVTYIETEEFALLKLPFSQAVRVGNILYLSGQVGDILETGELVEGGIVAETNQTMKNIKQVLDQNGSSMDKIIKCTCMLADIGEWGLMSAEYIKFFPDHKPARSAFGTTGLALGARVEIECIAYIN